MIFSPFSYKLLNLFAGGGFSKMIWKLQCIVLSGYLASLRSEG